MKPTETVHFKPDSVDLINLVIRYWKVLLITGIAAAVISAVISLAITPLFRSTVVLYPTTNVVESQTLFGIQNNATELFGDETATEKVLQILRSDHIKNYLVGKYDLMKHYGISPDAKYKYTLLNLRMNKYIISRKTQYNSVEISVLDADPRVASTMANDIARQIDTVFNLIVKDAGRKSYTAINNSYIDQFRRVKSLEDSLHLVSAGVPPSVYPGNLKAGRSNSSWGTVAGTLSAEFLRLINMFESENENLSAIRSRLTEAKMLAEQDLPYTHIINEARVSEKKAQPKRSLIVLASTLSTLLLMIFILGLADSLRRHEQ
jgi:capsular polysaccharide biosynthesis protein